MFNKILIANRGEIALRIIRCCREMDINTVLIYSDADKSSLPVMLASEAVCIGPAKATESYLKQDLIIDIAKRFDCDAIHPGYGFLSENAEFARKCEEAGIVFIGPSSEKIERMGNKQEARSVMTKAGVPIVPGSKGLVNSVDEAVELAQEFGYPVLLKASLGGGGKGMRRAYNNEELIKAYEMAKAEAKAAFGNDDMYLEKLIVNPHHIEVQILADKYGNAVHLGERECSIQRNNQKLLEETPAWHISESLREKLGKTAVKAAKAVDYFSAGTVEFVVDDEENFYFIEMNTRIQVEHPITEMVSDVDLIKEQIRIAAAMKLGFSQEELQLKGHSIECRINAKTPGKIKFLHFPAGNGIRIESHLYEGYEVSPFYDSMIAKIIVKGATRLDAVRKMRRALEELAIEGIETNAQFMYLLMYHPAFIKGNYNTSFWDEHNGEINKWIEEGTCRNGNRGSVSS